MAMNLDFFKEINVAVTVSDAEGNVVYQKGEDTRGSKEGDVILSEEKVKYHVIEDSESDMIYIDKNNLLYL